jgi:predicted Rossmann-fold nucleotide-binding protein
MGVLADAALSAGGDVVGVLPRNLFSREVGHTGLSTLELVDTMHERKARMAELIGHEL